MRTSSKHYSNLRLRGSSDIEAGDNELSKLPGSPVLRKQKPELMPHLADNDDAPDPNEGQPLGSIYSEDGTVLLSGSMDGEDADAKTGTFTVRPGCRAIGYKAFMYEEGLHHIVLPETIEEIDAFAFACSGLREFDAPANLSSIGEKAFFRCAEMRSVSLNEGLREIGREAFANCGIAEIALPETVSLMGRHAFADTPLEAQSGARGLAVENNPMYSLDPQGGLYRRTAGGLVLLEMLSSTVKEHTVLEGTLGIAQKAYARATKLESVTLPEGLLAIGKDAFRCCPRLRDINIPESLRLIGMNALAHTDIRDMYLPRNLEYLGPLALDTGDDVHSSLVRVRIHPENERFFTQSGLLCERVSPNESCVIVYFGPDKDVVIPAECTTIGPYAFASSQGIHSIRLHEGIRQANRFALKSTCKVDQLIFELPEPLEGRDTAQLVFPEKGDMRELALGIFPTGELDLEEAFRRADRAAYYSHSNFERGAIMCDRLLCPQFLEKTNRDLFEDTLHRHVLSFCVAFAKHGYMEGFEQLVELGFLTQDNIGDAIDQVATLKDANASAFLLDLKDRAFGRGVSDDYFSL